MPNPASGPARHRLAAEVRLRPDRCITAGATASRTPLMTSARTGSPTSIATMRSMVRLPIARVAARRPTRAEFAGTVRPNRRSMDARRAGVRKSVLRLSHDASIPPRRRPSQDHGPGKVPRTPIDMSRSESGLGPRHKLAATPIASRTDLRSANAAPGRLGHRVARWPAHRSGRPDPPRTRAARARAIATRAVTASSAHADARPAVITCSGLSESGHCSAGCARWRSAWRQGVGGTD